MLLLWAALSGLALGRLEAEVVPEGASVVELRFELELSETAEVLPITVLEIRGGKISELEANGEPTVLDRSAAPLLRGEVRLAPGTETLTLRYRIEGSTIPVVVPELTPSEARPDAFVAAIALPVGWHLVESFPSGINEADGRLELQLPVVPAFIALTLSEEEPFLSLPLLLDAIAISFFAVVGVVLFRRR